MKKILFLGIVFFNTALLFAGNFDSIGNNVSYTRPDGTKIEVKNTENDDVEALYCKVTYNGNSVTCWFCDCSELLETLKGSSDPRGADLPQVQH